MPGSLCTHESNDRSEPGIAPVGIVPSGRKFLRNPLSRRNQIEAETEGCSDIHSHFGTCLRYLCPFYSRIDAGSIATPLLLCRNLPRGHDTLYNLAQLFSNRVLSRRLIFAPSHDEWEQPVFRLRRTCGCLAMPPSLDRLRNDPQTGQNFNLNPIRICH